VALTEQSSSPSAWQGELVHNRADCQSRGREHSSRPYFVKATSCDESLWLALSSVSRQTVQCHPKTPFTSKPVTAHRRTVTPARWPAISIPPLKPRSTAKYQQRQRSFISEIAVSRSDVASRSPSLWGLRLYGTPAIRFDSRAPVYQDSRRSCSRRYPCTP
jgi:hypothetical protein